MKHLSLLALLFLFSCNQTDDLCGSCDEEVNSFVEQNRDLLNVLNAEEFQNIEITAQKASFNSFSKEERGIRWINKYTHLIEQNPDNLSKKEIQHISKLRKIVVDGIQKYDIFKEDRDEDDFNIFINDINEWAEKAYKDFKWDKPMFFFLLSSLNISYSSLSNSSITGHMRVMQTQETGCDCGEAGIWLSPCFLSSCNYTQYCTVFGSLGCGVLWLQQCIGGCAPINYAEAPGGDNLEIGK